MSPLTRWPSQPLHDQSRNGWGALIDDGRFAWRRLRHAPGFALVVSLTITLTVGANTAILSIADAVLFRPLPYADADNVAIVQMRNRKTGQQFTMTPFAHLQAINDSCPSVSEVGLVEPFGGKVRPTTETPDGPAPVPAVQVTRNYFSLLGIRAARGRTFTESDAGREGTAALLSYAAWQQLFGADESIVGRTITLGAASFDLVGVLPPGFVFPSVFAGRPSLIVLRRPVDGATRGGALHAIVRVASGATFDRAQAEVDAAVISITAATEEPATLPALNPVRTILYPVGRPIMRFLLAAAVFILLLGCANLANVLLVRGRRGLHDTAIRLALGASRARLIRPVVFEAILLGLGGALLALALTAVSFEALLRQVPPSAYGRADVGVDLRVVVIALGMGLACALSFSIVPAWRAAGVDVLALIQRRGGRGSRIALGRPLVAIQVAIATAVVFGAIVAGRAFLSILQIPVGFSSDRVALVNLAFPSGATADDRRATYDRVLQTLVARADIESAGAAGALPFSGRAPDEGVRSDPRGPLQAGLVYSLPGYFETLGIPVLRGRTWTTEDIGNDPDSAVVSVAAARALFGDRDPLGQTLSNGRDRTFHVIGVVADVRNFIDREFPPQAYILPPPGRGLFNVVVRTRERTGATLASIKTDVRRAFPAGLTTVTWWDADIAATEAYRNPRFQTIVLGGLAVLALGLTTLGIFGVVAYLVAARRREMGVRLAIGASPAALVTLVIRESLLSVALGLAGGILLIYWGRGLAEAQLFDIETSDPIAFVAATGAVLIAAMAASFIPARRATRINPTEVLRAE